MIFNSSSYLLHRSKIYIWKFDVYVQCLIYCKIHISCPQLRGWFVLAHFLSYTQWINVWMFATKFMSCYLWFVYNAWKPYSISLLAKTFLDMWPMRVLCTVVLMPLYVRATLKEDFLMFISFGFQVRKSITNIVPVNKANNMCHPSLDAYGHSCQPKATLIIQRWQHIVIGIMLSGMLCPVT